MHQCVSTSDHGWKIVLLSAVCTVALPSLAWAATPQAPDAIFLVGGSIYSNGQSNNLGPAAQQVLDDYWISGACPLADGTTSRCDALRLGLSVYARSCAQPGVKVVVAPQEDGGALVKSAMQSLHTQAGALFCGDTTYRPLDEALWSHEAATFPGGVGADEDLKDIWFERAHLTLLIVDDLPQSSEGVYGNRVKASLQATCELFEGNIAQGVPAMPSWVMLARQHHHRAAPFAGLLAAAGGTGTCCHAPSGICDPIADVIDVCEHASSRTEAALRADLAGGRYRCSPGSKSFSTGLMDFGTATNDQGTLPQIRCHLAGSKTGDICNQGRRRETDILGIFACVHQLPRGVSAEDAVIRFCPNNSVNCELLTEANGGIEFIDSARTLYTLAGKTASGQSRCQALAQGKGTIEVNVCLGEGEPCLTGKSGRCAEGRIYCEGGQELCRQLYAPMPEICNGLDNDCDGRADNLSSSSAETASLPASHKQLACFGRDACTCPNGAEAEHAGANLQSYLNAWTGRCHCSPSLDDGPLALVPEAEIRDGAACSQGSERRATGFGIAGAGLLLLLACMRIIMVSRKPR
ncbi:MAG: putative metal-binding motif-containing protein [Bradymonadaceae bacterium]|nr:putative metal-binding motif-containing protein [Lujinxingiaceae bacterium]